MKAVILAAGRGIRMNQITKIIPKCLLDINGMTILEKQLVHLTRNNIDEIYIVLGHQADKVKLKLNEMGANHIHVIMNDDYAITNNMFSLFQTEKFIKGHQFILLNGDAVVENSIIDKILKVDGSICPYDSSNFNPEELKVLIKDEKAYMIMPKKTGYENSNGSTIGIFKFSCDSSNLIFEDMKKTILNEKKLNEWFEYSLTNIFPKTDFNPLDIKGLKWIEIDDENDLETARQMFNIN